MTDTATRDSDTSEGAIVGGPATTETGALDTLSINGPTTEPTKKKRHLGWWIGGGAGVVVVGLVLSSLVLIPPERRSAACPSGS